MVGRRKSAAISLAERTVVQPRYELTKLDGGRRVLVKELFGAQREYKMSARQAVRDGLDIPWIDDVVVPVSGSAVGYVENGDSKARRQKLPKDC